MNNLFLGFSCLNMHLKQVIQQLSLLFQRYPGLLRLLLSRLLLLLLLFLLFLFLLLLAASLHFLFELDFNLNWVVFLKVPWNWDLNSTWVKFQIKQELVQMHIDRSGSWVECNEFLLDFTYPDNGGLKNRFYTGSLLWMNYLVVTFLQFLVNVDVFDVQTSVMLEPLLNGPVLRHFLLSFFNLLCRLVLYLNLYI